MESSTEKDSGSESPSPAPTLSGQTASFTAIEDYLELLYEDLPDKTRGSALILELAKDPNNLEDLASSGELPSVSSEGQDLSSHLNDKFHPATKTD